MYSGTLGCILGPARSILTRTRCPASVLKGEELRPFLAWVPRAHFGSAGGMGYLLPQLTRSDLLASAATAATAGVSAVICGYCLAHFCFVSDLGGVGWPEVNGSTHSKLPWWQAGA